jgi:hypothetical protein
MTKKERHDQQPSLEQIAELNSLLGKTVQLARELNSPYIMLSTYAVCEAAFSLIANSVIGRRFGEANIGIKGYLLASDDEEPSVTQALLPLISSIALLVGLLGILAAAYYPVYQLYNFLANQALKLVPQGVSMPLRPHPAFKQQEALGKPGEIATQITALKRTVKQQKKRYRLITCITYGVTLLAPTLLSLLIQDGQYIDFTLRYDLTPFGLILTALPGYGTTYANKLFELLNYNQALTTDILLYTAWLSYTRSSRLEKLMKSLKTLSRLKQCDINWELITTQSSNLESPLIRLSANRDHTATIQSADGTRCRVRPSDYMTEMHRFLLKHGIPVYSTDALNLYIGFFNPNKKLIQTLTQQFDERLVKLAERHTDISQSLRMLNKTLNALLRHQQWHNVTLQNDNGSLHCKYYLHNDFIAEESFRRYHQHLANLLPDHEVVYTFGLITLNGHVTELQNMRQELQLISRINRVTPAPATAPPVTRHTHSEKPAPTPRKRHKHKTKGKPYSGAAAEPEDNHANTHINFSNGIRYYRLDQNEAPPGNYAYPIRVPYLPPNCAFATVTPALIHYMSRYLTAHQIKSQLGNGSVHGYRARGSGIQIVGQDTNNPLIYRSITGEYHTACLKVKIGNFRLFGHWTDGPVDAHTNKQHMLCVFDGAGIGHR